MTFLQQKADSHRSNCHQCHLTLVVGHTTTATAEPNVGGFIFELSNFEFPSFSFSLSCFQHLTQAAAIASIMLFASTQFHLFILYLLENESPY